MSSSLLVEVAFATPQKQLIIPLKVAPGTTAEQAVRASGILQKFPEIDLAQNKLGIFGKLIRNDLELREHDRVEIYRALIADPKEVRRQRAAEGKAMKKGGGELDA